jgi:hypothetical protein
MGGDHPAVSRLVQKRGPGDLGFSVHYVTHETLTIPMTVAGGCTVSPAEIRARTDLVLAGRFARISIVEEVLERRVRLAA